MRDFDQIHAIAAERKGGAEALETMISRTESPKGLAKIPDDRWLAQMTKCIFQAGFHWGVVESKWPGFEVAFEGFDIGRCAMLHDEDFERLAGDVRIIRNPPKIRAVQANAVFLAEAAREHGSAAKLFAEWPSADYVGLLELIKKRGSRLGGVTGQRVLRAMGIDSFILSPSVVARLIEEGVVDKAPSSKRDLRAAQDAFNTWMDQSGRGLTEISRVLAMSVDV